MDWLSPEALGLLLDGAWATVVLTAITTVLSMILGISVGSLRLSRRPIQRLSAASFVELFRNIPALVLIVFFAFALPNLFPFEIRQRVFFDNVLANWIGRWSGLVLPYYGLAAMLGLILNTGAYLAELFRAGVGTIPRVSVDAARALGASRRVVFWTLMLPQGLRAAFPAIATRLIHNMKNTALASFVAVPELFQVTQALITRSFQALQFLLLAAAIYVLLAFLFSGLLGVVERRLEYGLPQPQ